MRIKTLGDCYYCVSGMPVARPNHAKNCVKTALSMLQVIEYESLLHCVARGFLLCVDAAINEAVITVPAVWHSCCVFVLAKGVSPAGS